MKIMTQNIMNKFVAEIDNIDSPEEGDLHVSPSLIMKNCDCYVGSMCAEFVDGEWLYQPYDRYTEYMTYDKATKYFYAAETITKLLDMIDFPNGQEKATAMKSAMWAWNCAAHITNQDENEE